LRKGYTLIEVLVAMVIFLIGVLGILPLLITNIRYNEASQKALVAQKILENVASELRSIQVYNFTKSNLETIGFQDNTPSGYPSVPTSPPTKCPPHYEYALFRGYVINKIVNGNSVKYKYTIKLCVDDNYLKPYLKRAKLWIYWTYMTKNHGLNTQIFITAK